MGDDAELLGLYWTVSGPVEVHTGREWSLFDFSDRCAQAAKVGFSGLGIWHADLEHVLQSRSLTDMQREFDANGLKHLELEFLMDWFVAPGDPRRVASDRIRAQLLEAAGALGAHHVKVGNIPGTPCELDLLVESYAQLCAQAAQQTDARIVYEFMPFDVNADSLEKALAIVDGAGAPNGGLALDVWHLTKLGISPDAVAAIPPQWLAWVELSDGTIAWRSDDHIEETTMYRALPGEGEMDVPGYIDAARRAGYPGPWGVETLSEELRNNPIDVIFRRAHDATASQFLTTRSAR
jgi:sugar phosphate isomerase/epimerase